MCVSALEATGVTAVLEAIETELARDDLTLDLTLPFDVGEPLAWLYEQGAVTERQDGDDAIKLKLTLSKADADRFAKRYQYNFT